jgi:hypothetical protein
MTCICRHCNEPFEATPEQKDLFENGYIHMPDVCDECFEMLSDWGNETNDFSDADNGL